MKFEKGSLIIANWQEAPVKIHWTVIISALFFSRFQFLPVFWVSFFGLVFIHEAGHAMIVRYYRLWVEEILIHGLGGYCRYEGETSEIQLAIIAWGGVFAQFIVLIIATITFYIWGYPVSSISYQIHHVFIETNIFIIILNLIPIKPLDGSKAWKIIRPLTEIIQSYFTSIKYRRQDKKVQRELQRIMNVDADTKTSNNQKLENLKK